MKGARRVAPTEGRIPRSLVERLTVRGTLSAMMRRHGWEWMQVSLDPGQRLKKFPPDQFSFREERPQGGCCR